MDAISAQSKLETKVTLFSVLHGVVYPFLVVSESYSLDSSVDRVFNLQLVQSKGW